MDLIQQLEALHLLTVFYFPLLMALFLGLSQVLFWVWLVHSYFISQLVETVLGSWLLWSDLIFCQAAIYLSWLSSCLQDSWYQLASWSGQYLVSPVWLRGSCCSLDQFLLPVAESFMFLVLFILLLFFNVWVLSCFIVFGVRLFYGMVQGKL